MRGFPVGRYVGVAILAASVVCIQPRVGYAASDAWITTKAKIALLTTAGVSSGAVNMDTVDGAVLLGGKAQTMGDHLRAIELTRSVPGVRKVESEIESPDRLADDEIRRQAEPSRTGSHTESKRGMGTTARDMSITADAKMRLLADADVPALDVNVDTYNGAVTLWGAVPTPRAKAAAEADARKISGVTRVVNELQV